MNQTQNPFLDGSFLSSQYFDPNYWFPKMVSFFEHLFDFLFGSGATTGGINIRQIFAVFGVFFFTVIAYCFVRLLEIRAKEHKHLKHEIAEYAHHHAERERKAREGDAISTNPQWVKVLDYIFSSNEADWKLAIIEADLMLESLMTQLGFQGETLGDKLKSADPEKFRSLTTAWEIHTIRNRIAHEGSAFPISQHEAKRVIALYEQIFRSFGYI